MKPADEPQINIAANASHRGLVVIAIGTGTNPYRVTPERADEIAAQLTAAAAEARGGGVG